MQLTCLHCDKTPEEARHRPGMDCVQFICGMCVSAAISHGGRSLNFPHDEQEEMFLSSAPTAGGAE